MTSMPEEETIMVPTRNDSFAWLLAILRDVAIVVFVIVYVIDTV